MATYLDFEEKIREVQDSIVSARIRNDYPAVEIFEKKLDEEVEKTYANLTHYQKLQLARHPDRPYSVDYIRGIFDISYELHGDRHYSDDQSIVGYLGFVGDQKLMVIGEQKGRGTKNKIKRNFGMPHPEGYRKALRLAKLAEKFDVPVLFLIDTPGAYPGLGAEERNQSEAIARNLQELSRLENITISVVIGEGGSGGALAIGVADKLAMMRYSVFSVISPEGCAAILWNDPEKVETATQALRITSSDLKELNLIDDIIEEPLIGAHRDKTGAIEAIRNYIFENIQELQKIPKQKRIENRFNKIINYGAFEEEVLNEVQNIETLEKSEKE